jgi:hypothetical protein
MLSDLDRSDRCHEVRISTHLRKIFQRLGFNFSIESDNAIEIEIETKIVHFCLHSNFENSF